LIGPPAFSARSVAASQLMRSPRYSMMRSPAAIGLRAKTPLPWTGYWRTSKEGPLSAVVV